MQRPNYWKVRNDKYKTLDRLGLGGEIMDEIEIRQAQYLERMKNRKRSVERKERMSFVFQKTNRRDNASFKYKKAPVIQYSLDGKFIAKYPSMKDAEIALGKERGSTSIHHCCKGRYKTAHGFRWEYGG